MIGKVLRGRRVQGLIRYLYGPGRNEEHRNPRIVAGFRSPVELEPGVRSDGALDFRQLEGLMTQPLAALGERNYRKPVWHVPVRAAPEDPVLTDQQWAQIAAGIMAGTGLAPVGDDDAVRWIAVRHADDHIHIVATLARSDGVRPEVWNDGYRVRDACRAAEIRYGLRRTAPADRTAARRASRGETEKAARRGRSEPPRVILRRHVQSAAAGARTEGEFLACLQAEGLLIRRRFSQRHPDQLTGYAVALPDDHTADGQPVWYGGGKLAIDLTLPRLRHRWSGNSPDSGPRGPQSADYQPVSGRHLSGRSAQAVLRTIVGQAADQARTAEEFFQRLHQSGLLIRQRISSINPGQITGYAVGLPEHSGSDGDPIWYTGGRLADDLTWPRIQRRWREHPRIPSPRLAGTTFSHEERQAIYNDAARAAAHATAQIRRCTVIDPHAARDACWAAADILHAAARATGNQHLRRAADAYDRAARMPYGRVPPATPAGNGLRTAARLIALVGQLQSGTTGVVTNLINSLVALTDAIGLLHGRQRRDAQAAASASTSEHLRNLRHDPTASWITGSVPSANPSDLARSDFPVPPSPLRWPGTPGTPRTSRSQRRPQSPKV
ncbi:hypothetical protein SMC26_24115 [Actinomadura fulvescens]|uniref:MobA/VirD2-like nuclease domain-containing protein n=1 Tax=Actinomadura fulvescens TaxID=46160 RepID=A0ABN3Q556_9ACTN